MKSHLNSISSPSQTKKNFSIKRVCSNCKTVWSWKNYCLVVTPSLVNSVWEIRLWPHTEHPLGCSDGNETALAATSRQTPALCFVVTLRPGLQSLVRKCLRVTAACSAKSHFILLMDRWTDGCLVKAALSDGASEWWIALFLLSPNHHRSKPYFSGQKPSNIKTHNQVKLLQCKPLKQKF